MSFSENRPERQSAGWPTARGRSPQRGLDGSDDRLRSRDRAPLPSESMFNEKSSVPAPVTAPKDDDDDMIAPSFAEATAAAQGETARVTRERETDPHRLAQRLRQLEKGKNTDGYATYLAAVPKRQRNPERRLTDHPVTPPHGQKMSKRAWDGLYNVWRRQLHLYDPSTGGIPAGPAAPAALSSGASSAGACSKPAASALPADVAADAAEKAVEAAEKAEAVAAARAASASKAAGKAGGSASKAPAPSTATAAAQSSPKKLCWADIDPNEF